MKERRRFKRFKAKISAAYTIVEGLVTIRSISLVKNICSGGLCALTNRIIKKGEVLLMEMEFSDTEQSLTALAKVVWIKSTGYSRHNICGLKFLWVSSKPLLDKILNVLEKDRQWHDAVAI